MEEEKAPQIENPEKISIPDFKEYEIDELLAQLKKYNVKVASIFSHLSSSDIPEEKEYTLSQIEIFKRVSDKIIKELCCKFNIK